MLNLYLPRDPREETSSNKRWLATLVTVILLLSGCCFRLRSNYLVSKKLHKIYLLSADPYSALTQALKEELQTNGIKVAAYPMNVPVLSINTPTTSNRVISLYSDGRKAEYELSYHVTGSVITAENHRFPIDIQLHRDNGPLEDQIHMMAAKQIIRQLATVGF